MKVLLHHFSKIKSQKAVTNQGFYDRRIRIRIRIQEAQKHVDPDPGYGSATQASVQAICFCFMICRIFLSFKKTYTLKTKQKIRPNNSSLVRFSNQSSPVTYSYGPATTGGIVLRSPRYASLTAAAAAAMGGGLPSWPRSARVRQYSLEY